MSYSDLIDAERSKLTLVRQCLDVAATMGDPTDGFLAEIATGEAEIARLQTAQGDFWDGYSAGNEHYMASGPALASFADPSPAFAEGFEQAGQDS